MRRKRIALYTITVAIWIWLLWTVWTDSAPGFAKILFTVFAVMNVVSDGFDLRQDLRGFNG
jgi:hypothetical protein